MLLDIPWKNTQPQYGTPLNRRHALAPNVACYLMNEGAGSTAFESFTGSSGNGATLVAGATWAQGGGITFDGSTGVLNGPVLAAANTPPLSVAAWINPSAAANVHTISAFGVGGLQFRQDGTQLRFVKGGVADIGLSSAGVLSANALQFVVGTYDTSGNFLFYVNGQPAGGGTNLQTLTTNQLTIGNRSSTEWFVGLIYSVTMYSRILTQGEVLQLYADRYCFMQPRRVWAPEASAAVATRQQMLGLLGCGA